MGDVAEWQKCGRLDHHRKLSPAETRRKYMHPFSPGDLVICIDDKPLPEKIIRIGEPWIKAGRAYRVCSTSTSGPYFGIELENLAHWPPAIGWHHWRFIKIEPADEAFTELLRAKEDA